MAFEREGLRPNPLAAARQLGFLGHEISIVINRQWWRWVTVWFGGGLGPLLHYRLERALYLFLGDFYGLVRPLFMPIRLLIRLFGAPLEIHYKAEIGPGLRVLHPNLGCVVSGKAIVGENLILVGGNCIGGRRRLRKGDLVIGDDVLLGANAVILGPAHIGDNCRIGACAVVIHDLADGSRVFASPTSEVVNAREEKETSRSSGL